MRLWLPIACVVLLGVSGCTQLDNALLEQRVQEVVTVETNVLGVALISTNYFTNYVVNPNAQAVADATNAVPVYGGLISLGLTTLLGFYRSVRNRKLAEGMVVAVDAGREAMRALEGDGKKMDGVFKDAMVREQQALGMQSEITKVVRKKRTKAT